MRQDFLQKMKNLQCISKQYCGKYYNIKEVVVRIEDVLGFMRPISTMRLEILWPFINMPLCWNVYSSVLKTDAL